MPVSRHAARFLGGNRMLEMTNENFARLLRGLTIAVGNRRNRILLYQFLAAEIRALHCSYGVGDDESYKRARTFLENCERYTLRSLVRRSAKHHAEVTVDHAKRIFSRALKKLDISQGHNPSLRAIWLGESDYALARYRAFLKHARKSSSHDQQLPRHGVWPTCGPNCAAYIAHSFPGTLGLFCRTRRLPPHMNSAKP